MSTPLPAVSTLAAVIAAHRRLDGRQIELADKEKQPIDRQLDALEDRREALEDALSHERAASWADVIMQLAVCRSEVECIASWAHGHAAPRVREMELRAFRLLHSVVTFVEQQSGVRREELQADHYIDREYDPLAAVEQALAE